MAGFHKAGPNEALIVSGSGKEPVIVVGGRKFVLPIVQLAQWISLEIMTLTVSTPKVYTSEGVAVTVDGVAQVKVGSAPDAIRTAAEQFIGKDPLEIANVALQTLEGQQRAILGEMSVEQIYRDRVAFADRVREVAATDMSRLVTPRSNTSRICSTLGVVCTPNAMRKSRQSCGYTSLGCGCSPDQIFFT